MQRSFLELKSSSSWLRYTVALLSPLAAALITFRLAPVLYPNVFPFFFLAVIISAWFGGFKPGVLTTALSVGLVLWITPSGWADSVAVITRLSTFVLISLLLSWLIGAFYRNLAAVREREAWFQDIFESSREAIFLVNESARFVECNAAASELTGYSREELISMRIPDLHDESDLEAFRNYFASIMGGQDVVSEAFLRRKDGVKALVEFSNRRMTFRGKAVMHTTARDITERRRVEKMLQESERQLTAAQQIARLGSWEWEVAANKVIWSEELYRIFGLEQQEFGATYEAYLQRVHPYDREFVQDVIENSLRERQPFNYHVRIVLPNGAVRTIHAITEVIVDEFGTVTKLVGTAQDVTERKLVEKQLFESEDRYRDLVEHSHVLMCTHDLKGRILSVNQTAVNVLGYDQETLLAKNIRDGLTPEYRDQFDDYIAEILRKGFARGLMAVYTKSGEKRIWEYNNTLRTEGIDTPIVRGMAHDITERKRAEQAREQLLKERRELLNRLVKAQEDERQRIARELHDQLGQQITALMLGIKLLKDSGHCQPQATRHLDRLQEYADQLGRELHHIAWELRPTALDDLGLHTALGNYLEKWSESSGKTAELHCQGFNGHRLSTQIETTLYRVIQEALTNVIKHSEAEFVSLILERRDNHVLAIVEDDGRGFNVEEVMSASESEHKLGLLGMRERLALVFGTLEIESTPGAGTSVFVRIPTPQIESEVGINEQITHSLS